ncbi:MAG: M3 family metallopeptidase [Planctomycetes bacterium]|nr:M3 family metallopeptidase [Planctomycetota bacterium]
MTALEDARRLIDDLAEGYVRLHTTKEDAFWTSYMGLAPDAAAARAELDRREIELQRFLRDPGRLGQVRAALAAPGLAGDERTALEGWRATFEAHAIDSAEARALAERIVEAEGALARARGEMPLGYVDPERGLVRASSVKLAVMLKTEQDARLRRAAWEGLRSIEPWVLERGFLDVVRLRNQLGRALGAEDYYDWKVQRAEGMTKAEVFALLDELEAATRAPAERAVAELRRQHGADQVAGWNVRFLVGGDVTRDLDPYFPFARALERWGRSFAALGIRYRGARMVLDLVDRQGKYENGFMHGPEVSWRRKGELQRARIQFTANAIPGMPGSGQSATATLFHEGGHAAHFANIDMPAPCFGQEFAPTSVAFAETQSMFLDSLLDDADWRARYARTADGAPMPLALIERALRTTQPFAAWEARAMLTVCYAEKALYELPDDRLTPDGVLSALREVERRLLFLPDGSPRPVLAVPHLLSGESSAYYHGYVLAEMGVQQTREHFLARDGHLVDNPRVGPELAEAYWRPGNSRRCSPLIEALTGRPLGAGALARHLCQTTDEALAEAREAARREPSLPRFEGPVDLDAHIRIAHGVETVAEVAPGGRFEDLSGAFGRWVDGLAAARA